MATKHCNKCGQEKDLSEFYFRKSQGRYRSQCKKCEQANIAIYYDKNKDKILEYKALWTDENRTRQQELAKARYSRLAKKIIRDVQQWRILHEDKAKEYRKRWKLKNPEKLREQTFIRLSYRKRSTPTWCNRQAMLAFYRKARALTKETGIEYHVDHMVPLRSKLVCGLHCEFNMQILSAQENISKLNRHWPDMP